MFILPQQIVINDTLLILRTLKKNWRHILQFLAHWIDLLDRFLPCIFIIFSYHLMYLEIKKYNDRLKHFR